MELLVFLLLLATLLLDLNTDDEGLCEELGKLELLALQEDEASAEEDPTTELERILDELGVLFDELELNVALGSAEDGLLEELGSPLLLTILEELFAGNELGPCEELLTLDEETHLEEL